ncbi:MAG: CPBP family intramembrane metalloprotease [Phycisphaerae bacterium]|nr:CPBP family intramembrane metalloprotease [Phycisphaerae bacterium]
MRKIFDILGEIESAEGFLGSVTVSEIITTIGFAAGVVILVCWLVRNKFFGSLDSAPARLNKMRLHTPLIQLLAWVILISITGYLARERFGKPLPIQGELALYIGMLAVELGMICSILVVAFMNFHGRLEGFGLDFRTFPKDLGWGAVNYVASMPLVLGSIWIIVYAGKAFVGGEFDLPKNDSLELLTKIHVGFKILVIFSAAFVVPVFEELLFRGLIQSTLRTHLGSPWLAIICTSLVFVVMHGIWQHWLPLMALSVCMGYAYEKSGSILRSICIHVIFNSVTIAGSLLGAS